MSALFNMLLGGIFKCSKSTVVKFDVEYFILTDAFNDVHLIKMSHFFNIELLYMCILIKSNFKCVAYFVFLLITSSSLIFCNITLYMNGDSEVLVHKKL